jgi:hypothetical protein
LAARETPLPMTKACVNSWRAAIAPAIRLNRIAGLIIGMVT